MIMDSYEFDRRLNQAIQKELADKEERELPKQKPAFTVGRKKGDVWSCERDP